MTHDLSRTADDGPQDTPTDSFRRREFVAVGAGVGATLLAGCAGDTNLTSGGGSDGSGTATGNFRLLISDMPADIGDFDRLDVTLDRARIFEAGEDGDEEEDDDEQEDDTNETDDDGSTNETEPTNETVDETEDVDDEDEEEERGFSVIDLEGATVDLTQVIEDDAMAVFDGELPAGSYEKIELYVSAIEGIVEGESVAVKLPSEKLQITNGFEVSPDESVSFVFDINVVKRGRNNGYILKPVISGSGVAGRDVEVNELDDEDDEDEEGEEAEDDGEAEDGAEAADDDGSGETDGGNPTDEETAGDGGENATETGDDS